MKVVAKIERWARDAVNLLQIIHHVDLFLLDLMLAEGVSRFDICDEIHALPQYAEVPIEAVSAMGPSIAMLQSQVKGFAGFMAKAVDNDLFPQQLGTILDGKPVWYTGELIW